MKIAGFLPESYQDHPDGLSSVIFTSGCNFYCPACHARQSVFPQEEYSNEEVEKLLRRIERKKKSVDKVVFCGGEPTLQEDLFLICMRLKGQGFKIKLDTNGSNPGVLEEVIGAVDYLALEIKAPRELYDAATGRKADSDGVQDRVQESIKLRRAFHGYELRTTIWPIAVNGSIRLMTEKEAEEMAEWVAGFAGRESKWFLQSFHARGKKDMIDGRFSAENLPEEMQKTPQSLLEKLQKVIGKYFDCRIR